ncbi:MAG TPA: glucuronate isomerase, partial [Gemmatimonadales bacterium]|nr:glucuronate isomerase [Gemmatimonadales bacterium]
MSFATPHEDRGFDPEPSVRRVARALYEETRALPIVSPHGHVEARLLADNESFPDPASLIVTPDHYILRMLYAHGVPLESLGVPTREDAVVETDPRAIWQRFAERSHVFYATPTG